MKEGLELIPRPEQPEWIMDGEHFAASLVAYVNPLPESAYPRRINLGHFTPVFDELYNTSQDVYFFTEEQRRRFHGELNSRGEPINDLVRQAREKEIEQFDRMVPGERNTILYVDPDAGITGTTPIRFGAKDSVPIDFRVPITQGYIPFASVHTHPLEYLPSAQDVSLMLRDFGDGLRQVKSGIVLLPNSQVLIIATDKTLALSEDQTRQFVEEWSGKIDSDPKLKRYESYAKIIGSVMSKRMPEMVDQVMQKLVAIEKRKDGGEISEEEMKQLADEVVEKNKINTEAFGYRLGKNRYKTLSVVERRANQIHLDMLRAAQVKTYVSYDKCNFQEFSI